MGCSGACLQACSPKKRRRRERKEISGERGIQEKDVIRQTTKQTNYSVYYMLQQCSGQFGSTYSISTYANVVLVVYIFINKYTCIYAGVSNKLN